MKRVIVTGLVLLALFAGFYYYDEVIEKSRDEAERKAGLLLDLEMGKVTKVAIRKPNGELILKKKNDDWRIAAPVDVDANDIDVDNIVQIAAELNFDRKIGEANDLSQYNLDNPTTINFYQSNGHQQTLKIGSASPTGGGYYVMTGDEPTVYLIERWQVNGMVKSEFDLRKRRLFLHQPGVVSKFNLRNKYLSISVEKNDNGKWMITSPIDAVADSVAVKALLDRVVSTLVSGFINDDAQELTIYGLDDPETTITIQFDDQTETLHIGGVTEGANNYAMIEGSTNVVRIPGEVAGSMQVTLDSIRDKTLAPVEPEDINEITITLEGKRVKLVSVPAESGDDDKMFRITEPVQAEPDSVRLGELLLDLSTVKAKSYVDDSEPDQAKYGLDDPLLIVDIITDEDSYKLKFSDKADPDNLSYYAMVNEDQVVRIIDWRDYDKLAKTVRDLKERRFFKVTSDQIHRIVINRLGQQFEIEKESNDYKLVEPEEKRIPSARWNHLVWLVTGLRFEHDLSELDTTPANANFENPALVISVYTTDGALAETVTVGAKTENGKLYFARGVNSDGLYTIHTEFVSNDIYNALETLVAREIKGHDNMPVNRR